MTDKDGTHPYEILEGGGIKIHVRSLIMRIKRAYILGTITLI